MSEYEEVTDGEPPTIDPYAVLEIEKEATADEVKRAYRKAALKNHPDKVPDDPKKKEKAHQAFQEVAFAYAVLSDPARRKRYDTTGSTSESIIDSEGFNWSDYYREQFQDAISSDAIEKFAKQYKGSDEEKDDVLQYFELCEGNMDELFEHVILSDIIDDGDRFREIIDEAITNGDVPNFAQYSNETKKQRLAKARRARTAKDKEAKEAEEYAQEMGFHDKLFGGSKGKGGKENSEDGLAALIQKRQQERSASTFLDDLLEKHSAPAKKSKGKKRTLPDEPPEEAFAAMDARRKSSKPSQDAFKTPPRKPSKRS